MLVVAYSDVHLANPETLQYLGFEPNFALCDALSAAIKRLKPDIVISCGDYCEQVYENDPAPNDLFQLTTYFINGNHDRWIGEDKVTIDNVLYSHKPCHGVHGHTHHPEICNDRMDLGSLTMTGTYGIITDGLMKLVRLPLEPHLQMVPNND